MIGALPRKGVSFGILADESVMLGGGSVPPHGPRWCAGRIREPATRLSARTLEWGGEDADIIAVKGDALGHIALLSRVDVMVKLDGA